MQDDARVVDGFQGKCEPELNLFAVPQHKLFIQQAHKNKPREALPTYNRRGRCLPAKLAASQTTRKLAVSTFHRISTTELQTNNHLKQALERV